MRPKDDRKVTMTVTIDESEDDFVVDVVDVVDDDDDDDDDDAFNV